MTIMKESLHLTCTEQNSGGIFCYPTTSQQARIFYVENAAYEWNWGGGGMPCYCVTVKTLWYSTWSWISLE